MSDASNKDSDVLDEGLSRIAASGPEFRGGRLPRWTASAPPRPRRARPLAPPPGSGRLVGGHGLQPQAGGQHRPHVGEAGQRRGTGRSESLALIEEAADRWASNGSSS
jgi:hypothetical protein